MDNDEKGFIVLRRTRARFLKRKQLFEIEITGVRQRRHTLMLASTLQRFNDLTIHAANRERQMIAQSWPATTFSSAAGNIRPTPREYFHAPSTGRVHTRAREYLADSARTRASPVCWSCPRTQSHPPA